ncbi:MAG TPA: G1 family glutamic endopeptidase [Streptosporangiaceae bacterium]|nr:G1 family glutamic endopeptidase [Streptosporangiaceae bacterium]
MLRRWSILLAMLAMTLGTVLSAGTTSAAAAELHGQAGFYGGPGWTWPPTGTQNWSPGGPINRASQGFQSKLGQVDSTNWSGYAGTTGTFTSVTASWTQPAGTCSSGDQYAAFWVGLDGYSSSTVEQTGSEVDCIGKTAEYYAWYEAYPKASVDYNEPVKAGDSFTATVSYVSGTEYALTITDTSESWTKTTDVNVSGTKRSSAEVIAEAPCCTLFGGILPLTDFGTVNFTGATVTPTSGSAEAMASAPGVTAITMVNNERQDKDTVSSLSTTAPVGEAFSCTWVRSS